MIERWKEGWRAVGRSAFVLTADERKIVCLILALALIGLAAKAWHRHKLAETPPETPAARPSPS